MGEIVINPIHNSFNEYRKMNLVNPYLFNTIKLEFVFSTVKIVPAATKSIRCRNSAASIIDIGFTGNIINTSQITAHSAGAQSYGVSMYNQVDNVTMINTAQPTQVGYWMLSSNASGVAIDYLKDSVNQAGLVGATNFISTLNMTADVIFQFVTRNHIALGDGVCAFKVRNTSAGKEGVFNVAFRKVGTDYVISVQTDYSLSTTPTAQIAWIVPIGTNVASFKLFTFSKIQGVTKLYVNGVEATTTTTPNSVFYSANLDFSIGQGSLNNVLSGGQSDFKTLSLISARNLSQFNLNQYINDYMAIHGL